MVTVTLHQDRIIRIKLKIVSLNLNPGLCVLFTVFTDKTNTKRNTRIFPLYFSFPEFVK